MLECYVVLDLEMTGLNPKKDRIIEIGAARIKQGMVVEEYETFVNPGIKIPDKVTQITGITDDMVSVVILNATIYMPFAELVDIRQEIERLEKEEKRLSGELARVNGMLNNERFMSKAPEAKVAEEREKLVKYTQMMEQVKERLAQLRK